MNSTKIWVGTIVLLLVFSATLAATVSAQSEFEKKAQRLIANIQAGDNDAGAFYDVACYLALAGKTDEAFRYLAEAINRGYANVEHISKDSDLKSLHSDARWPSMIAKATAKQKEQVSLFYNQKEFWDNPALQTAYQENISETEKIAGLAKFWSEAKYNFANFDLVPGLNWDATFLEFLPKVRETKSALEYYRVLQEMCARLKDAHTNISPPSALQDYLYARPRLRTRLIEDKVIVMSASDELQQNGIKIGQEVAEINGLPVKEYAAKNLLPYISASTPQDLDTRLYEYFLFIGPAKETLELTLRDEQGTALKKIVPRLSREEVAQLAKDPAQRSKPTPPFEMKMLADNVAYVKLNTFLDDKAADQFEAAFDEIAKSSALIIDVRNNGGGNSSVGWRVLSFLTDQPFKTSSWTTRQYRPAFRAWGRAQVPFSRDANESAPNGKKLYSKPVIVLTSSRTFSAAEDFMVAYRSMKRGLVIGEPTGGSTGQPLYFTLPGGGGAVICSKRDRFPDGTDFIGRGVQPDKLVHPTLADFKTGRDTVLEAALQELKSRR